MSNEMRKNMRQLCQAFLADTEGEADLYDCDAFTKPEDTEVTKEEWDQLCIFEYILRNPEDMEPLSKTLFGM